MIGGREEEESKYGRLENREDDCNGIGMEGKEEREEGVEEGTKVEKMEGR